MYRVEGGPIAVQNGGKFDKLKKCNISQFVKNKILATELSN